MFTVVQAYQFALDPTPQQNVALRSHCGAQRFAFNWGLAQVKANLDQRTAEASYGLPVDALTPGLTWSAYGLRKGPKVRFPRFKGKRAGLSCRFTTGGIGLVDCDRRHVKLPRIGVVRTQESTRKLARHVERGTARIRSATVSFRSGRWLVSFSVEITRTDPPPAHPSSAVGVDLGVRSLAVLSTGDVVPNPKHLEIALRELHRLQRQAARRAGPDKRTQTKPSQRWRTTQARIARLHARVANARRDGLHKLSTRLVREFGAIVLEDLNVAGMLRNRRLARHVAGVGMAELRRQVEYKAAWAGGAVHIADRWYPDKPRAARALGIATGRPTRSTSRRKAKAHETFSQGFVNG